MSRRSLLFIFLAIVTLGTISIVRYRFGNDQKFVVNLLTVADLRKNNMASVAESVGSTSTPTLADVLQELQDQQRLLAGQVADLRTRLEVMDLESVFTRDLQRGSTGDDVSKLQELLGQIPGIYPPEASSSPVTGFYGSLTKIAVMKFQQKTGLKRTGIFDQNARKKLFELAGTFVADENTSTQDNPIDLSAVPEVQNLGSVQDQISQLSSGVSNAQAGIADLQNQISQISSDLSNTQASVATLSAAPQSTPAPSSVPASSIPLTISNVQVVSITKNSATVTWASSNPSTSEVDYSQNSNFPPNQTTVITNASATTTHQAVLSSLNPGTKYYYRITSKDSAGGISMRTNLTFTTAH